MSAATATTYKKILRCVFRDSTAKVDCKYCPYFFFCFDPEKTILKNEGTGVSYG
jgi:hypothetical protein